MLLMSRFFPFKADPFLKGLGVQKSRQEVTEVISLYINAGKSTKHIQSNQSFEFPKLLFSLLSGFLT